MPCLIILLILVILFVPVVGPVLLIADGVSVYVILEAIVIGLITAGLLIRWAGQDQELWETCRCTEPRRMWSSS